MSRLLVSTQTCRQTPNQALTISFKEPACSIARSPPQLSLWASPIRVAKPLARPAVTRKFQHKIKNLKSSCRWCSSQKCLLPRWKMKLLSIFKHLRPATQRPSRIWRLWLKGKKSLKEKSSCNTPVRLRSKTSWNPFLLLALKRSARI